MKEFEVTMLNGQVSIINAESIKEALKDHLKISQCDVNQIEKCELINEPKPELQSKKHNVYYMGKFIKEIEFDRMETCFLSQSYRYYNKGNLIGVMPFDYSFFASNGEIIRFDELEEPINKQEVNTLFKENIIESTNFECDFLDGSSNRNSFFRRYTITISFITQSPLGVKIIEKLFGKLLRIQKKQK